MNFIFREIVRNITNNISSFVPNQEFGIDDVLEHLLNLSFDGIYVSRLKGEITIEIDERRYYGRPMGEYTVGWYISQMHFHKTKGESEIQLPSPHSPKYSHSSSRYGKMTAVKPVNKIRWTMGISEFFQMIVDEAKEFGVFYTGYLRMKAGDNMNHIYAFRRETPAMDERDNGRLLKPDGIYYQGYDASKRERYQVKEQ